MIEECQFKPWIWRRFLDDVFMIRLHGREKLAKFLNNLNSFHEQIKFTWEISMKELPCLDVKISIRDGRFTSDI